MERFPNLARLVLQGPKVTDAGLSHLKGLKQLDSLLIYNTGVTEKGKADLQQTLPKLKIQ